MLLNNAAVPQGSWSVVFLGGFFHPAQAAQPSSLSKCVSYALEGKERQRKIPYFYDPLGGSLIIIPVTDQNWELLILILVTFHLGGTVSTSQGQGWLHRQTTNQRQLLQMPCKCHTWQSDVKYWSGSAKRVLTPNCSTISLICLPDIGELLSHAFFFDMPSVIFPGVGWEHVAGDPSRQFAAHHMCPFKATKSKGQLPPDKSMSTPWETDIWTAAHTTNRFQDLTQYGRENIRRGPLSGRCYPIISLCPEQVMAFL